MNEWKNEPDHEISSHLVEFEIWRETNQSGSLVAFAIHHNLSSGVLTKMTEAIRFGNILDATFNADTSVFPSATPTTADDLTGKTVGAFKILRLLGRGGMGAVWLAQQEHPVSRRVAIKFIASSRGSDHLAQRLLNEQQIMAKLFHPNIASVLETGDIR